MRRDQEVAALQPLILVDIQHHRWQVRTPPWQRWHRSGQALSLDPHLISFRDLAINDITVVAEPNPRSDIDAVRTFAGDFPHVVF